MDINTVASRRSAELRSRLRRNKLVFTQLGSNFDVLRNALVASLEGTPVGVLEFAAMQAGNEDVKSPIVLGDVDLLAERGEFEGVTLGEVRQRANEFLEAGSEICLLSRVPRIAYRPVPGSSLIDDASFYSLPLLAPSEGGSNESPAACIPRVCFEHDVAIATVLEDCLHELGVEVLTSLDQAIFEAQLEKEFLSVLDPRVVEALRGAGLAAVTTDKITLSIDRRFNEFRDAISEILAHTVEPQSDLSAVMNGLWFIERTIRRKLREKAIENNGNRWRRNVLHGDLAEKVLGRARSDASVTAKGVSDLRDPIEWLTIGELLEVVQTEKHEGLGLDNIFWRQFELNVVPIRNRISHMRTLKKGDREKISMWVAQVKRAIPAPDTRL